MADGDDIPRQSGKSREWILKYGLVGPVLVFLVSFNLFPLFYNIVLSFSNSKLTRDGFDWIGTKNYGRLFDVATHPEYAAALQTTALFVVLAVSIELLLGFFLALSLRDKFKGKTVILIILLIPMMLSPAVMGIFWRYVLDAEFGVINQFLSMLKVSPPVWQRDWKFTTILLIDIWMWTPFMMLISLAALNAIPKYIYEAAEIDQASRWTVFRRITLPMCAPLLILAALLRTTDALKQFDLVAAITGYNDSATQTLSALTYREAILDREIGMGSAYACVILVIVIAMATIFTRYLAYLQKRQGKET